MQHQFKMKKNIIFTTLAIVMILAFYLLNAEVAKILIEIEEQEIKIEEQQTQIVDLKKQLGYHDVRISSQMDTLMVHRSRLEQIKKFLENRLSHGIASK